MKPWYCEVCETIPGHFDRWVISEDALRADGKNRAYRIRKMNLCTKCMREREKAERPTEIPGQEGMFQPT